MPPSSTTIAEPSESVSFAVVAGKTLADIPKDLYIPPDALEIILETFEGPLDLLLYLIRQQNLDIREIPITKITEQYLQYIHLMQEMQLDMAAEYLLMAALLLEIKSRLLLPQLKTNNTEINTDPRATLISQLEHYALFKQAAEDLANLPILGQDVLTTDVAMPDLPKVRIPPTIQLFELLGAMQQVLLRLDLNIAHQIIQEPLSVRERMSQILTQLTAQPKASLQDFYYTHEDRAGVIVALLALLELAKEQMLQLEQNQAFAEIKVSLIVEKPAQITLVSEYD